jgi:hypothetical protein
MLDGDKQAGVSSQADGVTCSNERFTRTINGSAFHVFDTAGLNEGHGGRVSPRVAIDALFKLIRDLETGVNLLVYVMRAPRVTAVVRQNYKMFHDIICDKQVPIVIVITGLEQEMEMDDWWFNNRVIFDQYRMSFAGFACITATVGTSKDGKSIYDLEYAASKKKLERLIYYSHKQVPWRMEALSWFASTAARARRICAKVFGFKAKEFDVELKHLLQLYDLTDQERKAMMVEGVLCWRWIRSKLSGRHSSLRLFLHVLAVPHKFHHCTLL